MKLNKTFILAFMLLLPVISSIGSIFTGKGNNIISLTIIIFIVIIFFCTILLNNIKDIHYVIIIFLLSLSLLYQSSFISNHIVGYDMNVEHYVYSQTRSNYYWNVILSSNFNVNNYNSILSVTILPTMINVVTGMNGIVIYKYIYPLLFSFTPIILYLLYKKIISIKLSFLSVFLFMSPYTYSSIGMISLGKQMIAMLILSMLLYIIINKNINKRNKTILIFFLGFTEIISHYSTLYVFIFILIVYYLYSIKNPYLYKNNRPTINIMIIFTIFIMAFLWYSSGMTMSSPIKSTINVIMEIIKLNPRESFIINMPNIMFGSLLRSIGALTFYLVQGIIFLGFVFMSIKNKEYAEYYPFSLSGIILILTAIIIPRFGSSLLITRFYQISMIILSPLFVLGIKFISQMNSFAKFHKYNFISYFIVILFFLFQIGFIYEIAGDTSGLARISLSLHRVEDENLYYGITNDWDVFGASWLSQYISEELENYIYSDDVAMSNVLASYGLFNPDNRRVIKSDIIVPEGYIYMTFFNMKYRKLIIDKSANARISEVLDEEILYNENLIYSNGGSKIFFST